MAAWLQRVHDPQPTSMILSTGNYDYILQRTISGDKELLIDSLVKKIHVRILHMIIAERFSMDELQVTAAKYNLSFIVAINKMDLRRGEGITIP